MIERSDSTAFLIAGHRSTINKGRGICGYAYRISPHTDATPTVGVRVCRNEHNVQFAALIEGCGALLSDLGCGDVFLNSNNPTFTSTLMRNIENPKAIKWDQMKFAELWKPVISFVKVGGRIHPKVWAKHQDSEIRLELQEGLDSCLDQALEKMGMSSTGGFSSVPGGFVLKK